MKSKGLACVMALAVSPAWSADPGSAQAAVPPPTHLPVFSAPSDAPPALDWRDANDLVGRFTRGHIDLLRWEADQAKSPADRPPAAVESGPVLGINESVQRALTLHAGAFAQPGMSALERLKAQAEAAEVTHRVRRAWMQAVTAQQALALHEAEWEAARTGAELSARMQQVGNWSAAQNARQQQMRNEAGQALIAARLAAAAARESLVRELALWSDERLRPLPAALEEVPAEALSAQTVEAEAVGRHPALARARQEARLARAAVDDETWSQAQALLREAAASAQPVLDTRRVSWSHALERALRLDMEYRRMAATVRSNAREAWVQYRHAHELARLAQPENVRLARQLEEDTQQRYNGMLKSTWDLLDAVRARLQAERLLLEARRDFWLAHNDLTHVLAGGDYAGPTPLTASPGRAGAPQGH